MTAEPGAPGAPAIYLYTQLDQDTQNHVERIYRQIKVLTEEGRDRANIQLAYRDPQDIIDGIAARVIQPDGSIVEFRDKVYDRPLAVNRANGWRAKSFTLPDVRIGSVIEYQYYRLSQSAFITTRWVLNQDLFTRLGQYSMRHPAYGTLQWSWPKQLPPGTAEPVLEKGVVRMQTRDVPPLVIEPLMPPPDEMAMYVEIDWQVVGAHPEDPVAFWNDFGRKTWKDVEDFLGKPRDVSDELARIIAPGDTDSQKATKLYEHVRHMRNVWTENPAQRRNRDVETVQKARNIRAVVKNGFGSSNQLQLYFLALARAAGLDASPVQLVSRAERLFFEPAEMQSERLTSLVVALRLDGREMLLDPAEGFLPFGKLYWSDTGVAGLKLDKDGGQWVMTPAPRPADAMIRRRAALTMSTDGLIEGTLDISYSGHEASWRIRELRYLDEELRREFLQEEVRQTLATAAEVRLVREPDWGARGGTIEVSYRVSLPRWTIPSGNKMLVGVGLFGALEKWLFIPPERQHPVYFEYPVSVEDELNIALPPGFKVQDIPATVPASDPQLQYKLEVTPQEGAVTIRRMVAPDVFLVSPVHYPRIRGFFEGVRRADEGQLVLTK